MVLKARFRCALVIAALFLGVVATMSTQAQTVSYTLTPVGPAGLGFTGFFTNQPCGYSAHLFLGNWFESPDEGETWEPTLSRYPGIAGQVIEDRNDPQIEYMSCYPGPFARSLDGGQTWQVISSPFGANDRGWSLTQDAAGVLYIQASQDGTTFYLYTSSDDGATWNQVLVKHGKKKISDGSMILSFWADPVIPGMLYAFRNSSRNSAFLVSEDGGRHWRRREHGMPHRPNGRLHKAFNPSCFAQSSVAPYSIYALGNLKQAFGYYTDDRGKHWHAIKVPVGIPGYLCSRSLRVKPGTNDVLWALARTSFDDPSIRFAESRDKGTTWTLKGTIAPSEGWTDQMTCGWSCPFPSPVYSSFQPSIPTNLLVSENGNIVIDKRPEGILLSTDGGNTFRVQNDGAMGWSFDQLFRVGDGTIFASSHNPYLWKSTDNGRTWTFCDWAPYISLFERQGGGVVGLDGNGMVWSFASGKMSLVTDYPGNNIPGGIDAILAEVATGSSNLLILGECQNDATFYSSSDLGATWTTLGTVPMLTGLTALTADPRDSSNLVVGGWFSTSSPGYESPYDAWSGGIYCSSDGGATWTAAMDVNAIGGVTCLYRDKANPDVLVASAMGYAQAPGAQGGIFVSLDGGETWQRRDNALPSFSSGNNAPLISAVVSPPDGQTLYAAVQLNGGIYRSDDLGMTWSKITDLPLRLSDNYIAHYLGDITIRRTAVTRIMPLDDGTGDLLIATMGQGLFIAKPPVQDPGPWARRKVR